MWDFNSTRSDTQNIRFMRHTFHTKYARLQHGSQWDLRKQLLRFEPVEGILDQLFFMAPRWVPLEL